MNLTSTVVLKQTKGAYSSLLLSLGFIDVGGHAYKKTVNKLDYFVGSYVSPRRLGEPFDINIQVCVYSEEFAIATRSLQPNMNWLDAQIRASVYHLDPLTANQTRIHNHDQLRMLLPLLPRYINEVGIPFLNKFRTTNDLVGFIDENYDEHTFMFHVSKDLAKWQTGVWRGEIDPDKEPWKPPSRGPIHTTLEELRARGYKIDL